MKSGRTLRTCQYGDWPHCSTNYVVESLLCCKSTDAVPKTQPGPNLRDPVVVAVGRPTFADGMPGTATEVEVYTKKARRTYQIAVSDWFGVLL